MANRFRELRESRGLNQTEVGKLANVAQSAVSKWERGESEPPHGTLRTLADFYGVSIDYLLGREAENEKAPDTAEAVSEAKEFSVEEATQLLVDMGLIRKGQQISDDDLAFLSGVFSILTAWFRKGEQDRGK